MGLRKRYYGLYSIFLILGLLFGLYQVGRIKPSESQSRSLSVAKAARGIASVEEDGNGNKFAQHEDLHVRCNQMNFQLSEHTARVRLRITPCAPMKKAPTLKNLAHGGDVVVFSIDSSYVTEWIETPSPKLDLLLSSIDSQNPQHTLELIKSGN